jgi:chemotaxis protein MotA
MAPGTSSPPRKKTKGPGLKPDLATVGGLVLAVGGILGGLLMEGGRITDVSQVTAAMIVLGGTLGAVMVTTPPNVLLGAVRQIRMVFFDRAQPVAALADELVAYATKARKNGLVSLEEDAMRVEDPFLRKALNLAVDGSDLQELHKMMELEMNIEEHRAEAEAKVYEAAGGYAPTIGIIGAVLGLIQVMKHLENIEEVGKGIAVAFVATVYGVGSANVFFLPAAAKLRARAHRVMQMRELALEGVTGIVEGLNPKLLRTKLEAYGLQQEARGRAKPVQGGAPLPAAAPAAARK